MSPIYLYDNASEKWEAYDSNDKKALQEHNVEIGYYVTLGHRVTLGENVTIRNNVTLGDNVTVGDNVTLGHRVTLGDNVTIGNNVTVRNKSIIDFVLSITGTRHPVIYYGSDEIAIGCHQLTIQTWLENYAEIGNRNGYTPEEIEEYRGYIEAIALLHKGRKR